MLNKVLAAFIFFTRLPFGRLKVVPADTFKNIVAYWPIAGWLTSGISVLCLYLFMYFFPYEVALLLAILSRVLVTGGLHEDGLADFFDGFGGGSSRERILAIMKDSHIGSYGVMGLLFYFMLLYFSLKSLSPELAGAIMLSADPIAKCISGWIINILPYARKETEAKNKTVYSRMTLREKVILVLGGALPLLWLPDPRLLWALLVPLSVFLFLVNLYKRKIDGYTGDCCGATCLLCELSFYLAAVVVLTVC